MGETAFAAWFFQLFWSRSFWTVAGFTCNERADRKLSWESRLEISRSVLLPIVHGSVQSLEVGNISSKIMLNFFPTIRAAPSIRVRISELDVDGCIAVAVSLELPIVSVNATDLAARLIMAAARHNLQHLAPHVTDVGLGPTTMEQSSNNWGRNHLHEPDYFYLPFLSQCACCPYRMEQLSRPCFQVFIDLVQIQ